MRTHELKVWPLYYRRIVSGYKTVELRLDDRGYQTGDTLVLQEFDPEMGMYTGRSCERLVTDIIREGPWLAEGYVAMSIRNERKTLVDTKRLDALEALEQSVNRGLIGETDGVTDTRRVLVPMAEYDAHLAVIDAARALRQTFSACAVWSPQQADLHQSLEALGAIET